MHPIPVLLPGKSHGWRSLVGCSPWVTKSQTRLSDFTFTFHFHALGKEMATHSSVLAWSIPGMAEPGGLPSMGLHRVGHDWSDLAAAGRDYHSHNTSDTSGHQMCGDFSTTEPFSEIPAGCLIIQFNSNTNPSSRPQRWRTQSHKAVPHPRFRCKSQVIGPQVTHNFCLTWLPITGSWDLLWIWSFWNSSHYCFLVIKEYHKGYR